MTTLEMTLLILLVINALALAGLVLLQQGKGADIGAAFGSGSSNTVFGSAGSASFLTKATVWLAIGFFVISFGLAYTAKERASGIRDQGIPLVEAGVPREETVEQVPEVEGAVETVPADVPDMAEQAPDELTVSEESVDSDIPDL